MLLEVPTVTEERQLTAVGFGHIFLNSLQLNVGAAGLRCPVLGEGKREGSCWWPQFLLNHEVMTSKPGQVTDLRSREESWDGCGG